MKRDLLNELIQWKHANEHIPLLLRGARQVGKTYLIKDFATEHFAKFHNINFEFEPEYKDCFTNLDPKKIITSISGLSGERIEANKSLLFLDEIQHCPNAIKALRYFKEKMPELHVIGAGSLLEFALRDETLSMPVGRIEYLYLKPMSFREFLMACGHEILCEAIANASFKKPLSLAFHNKLLSLTQDYLLIGGMPAAVSKYLETKDLESAHRQQTIILTTYRDDFAKYAKTSDHKYLQNVFMKVPALIGQQIQYSKIDSDSRSRDLKRAIQALNYAGVIQIVYSTSASGLPLNALINDKKFKLLFLDIGLVNRTMRLSINDLQKRDISFVNSGAVAEQLVGQELIAYMDAHEEANIHYWSREKRGSQAEVDYIINVDSTIVPIEVKAGNTGSLKSLHLLMKEYNLPIGVRISQQALQKNNNILSVPFYMLSELSRLIITSE